MKCWMKCWMGLSWLMEANENNIKCDGSAQESWSTRCQYIRQLTSIQINHWQVEILVSNYIFDNTAAYSRSCDINWHEGDMVHGAMSCVFWHHRSELFINSERVFQELLRRNLPIFEFTAQMRILSSIFMKFPLKQAKFRRLLNQI